MIRRKFKQLHVIHIGDEARLLLAFRSIVHRCTLPWKGFCDLLGSPLCGGICGNIEVKHVVEYGLEPQTRTVPHNGLAASEYLDQNDIYRH